MNIGRDTEHNDVDNKDDANIQYGYRRSRKRTSYEYRGSSSLTPAQIMEQETYYRYAEVAVQRITYRLVWAKKVSLAAICLVAGSASFGLREN
jgi:hypothetical protein